MKVKVKKISKDAKLPERAHNTDAGADLFALSDTKLLARQTTKISTGIAIDIPKGYAGVIWDKSSFGSKGLKVMGGLCDAGYLGEYIVCLYNSNNIDIEIKKGQKIAQVVILPVYHVEFEEVKELSISERAEGGFGSTGIK